MKILRTGILITACFFLLCSSIGCSRLETCRYPEQAKPSRVVVNLITPGFATRSASPDEDLISDVNIFIFSSKGELENSRYLQAGQLSFGEDGCSLGIDVLKNNRYYIYVCANLGYRMKAGSIEEIENFRHHLSRPDDFSRGIPMSGCLRDVAVDGERVQEITIPLRRAMARVHLKIDRSRLDSDVEYFVRSIKVVGCPKSVLMFQDSRAESADDLFGNSYVRSDLNGDPNGDLYLLENMQGSAVSPLCSYIEMQAEYISDTKYTNPGKYLTYRFYLGDRRQDFNVCRNCTYTVTVMPLGDGLGSYDGSRGDAEWRIDKSDLQKFVQSVSLDSHSLQFSYAGESSTLSASIEPLDAGNTYLEWRSSNPSVATVSLNGNVTAVGSGSCTISCWSTDGSLCKDECTVDVNIQPAWVRFNPSGYIEAHIGETLRIWAEYFPPNMSCRIDKEDLDFDVATGLYDYRLSEDRSSVELYIKAKGSGMFRFEVGEPLDTSAIVYIRIEP